jgi:hypothetical protein
MNTVCSQCNAPMSCSPGHDCWCSTLPHALPVPDQETTGCLCRDCLTKKLTCKRLLPFLPQIVHCCLPVAALDSPHGTSGGSQSWSYRLHCLPGAGGGLEQLPHCALSPESSDPQRATPGVDDGGASKGASFPPSLALPAVPLGLQTKQLILCADRWMHSAVQVPWRTPLSAGTRRD